MSEQWLVPQFVTSLGEEEAEAAARCVRSGWITEGPLCEEFVERVSKLAGVKYGVLAPNGTLALYLALRALNIGPGKLVAVPDLTFIATATAALMTGAGVRFVDVGHDTAQSDLSAWRWHEDIDAVIPVHLFGSACGNIRQRLGDDLLVVEDACQALGVTYNGKPCGSFGNAAAFSFFADKVITTGEGGFVGTNDPEIYERLRYLRNQGRLDRGSFMHPAIGQNFRMTDVQAAIGLVQLAKFDTLVKRRQEIWARYDELLDETSELLQPVEGSTHIPFRAVVMGEWEAGFLGQYLRERGIEPRSCFYPLHRQPCFAGLPGEFTGKFPNSNWFYQHSLCLPTYPGMSDEQVELVAHAVNDFATGRL